MNFEYETNRLILRILHPNYASMVLDFYEQNKDRIKSSSIEDASFNIEKNELELLSELIQQQRKNK